MDWKRAVFKYEAEAVEIRRELHRNPELSGKEYKTSALIRKKLLEYGASIDSLPIQTGISALIVGGKSGKTVMLREDIDALPMQEQTNLEFSSQAEGVCHSCGHDIHTAALLLIVRILCENREELSGAVRVVFQPAEETMSGAKAMIAAGVMQLLPIADAVVGVHTAPGYPVGSIAIIKGAADASSDKITIRVCGKGGHGAHPHGAVDPVLTAAYLLTQLQSVVSRENSPLQPAVLTFGSIHGGTAPNIIPEEVVLCGNLRSLEDEGRKKMWDAIRRISKNCCEAMRGTAEVEIEEGVPVLYNDSEIIDLIEEAAKKTIGSQQIYLQPQPSTGSDDFSCFLENCRGAQIVVGTANRNPNSQIGLHSPKVQFDEGAIAVAAQVLGQYIFLFNSQNT